MAMARGVVYGAVRYHAQDSRASTASCQLGRYDMPMRHITKNRWRYLPYHRLFLAIWAVLICSCAGKNGATAKLRVGRWRNRGDDHLRHRCSVHEGSYRFGHGAGDGYWLINNKSVNDYPRSSSPAISRRLRYHDSRRVIGQWRCRLVSVTLGGDAAP